MKRKWSQILASLVLAVFVNFMFANIIFMHVHKDAGGHSILHSHPYLPNSQHSHTAHALDLIDAFNLTALSADTPQVATAVARSEYYITFSTPWIAASLSEARSAIESRGPPTK